MASENSFAGKTDEPPEDVDLALARAAVAALERIAAALETLARETRVANGLKAGGYPP